MQVTSIVKTTDGRRIARKFKTTWYKQVQAGSTQLVQVDQARDDVQDGWIDAKYCRPQLQVIRVDSDLCVLSRVPLVHAQAPLIRPPQSMAPKKDEVRCRP